MRVNSPSVVLGGACVMALFPERVAAASISVHTATIVLAAIAAVYITITTLLAIAVCCLLCGKSSKRCPATCTSATTTRESIELQLSPAEPSKLFKGKTPKEPAVPSQKVTITKFSTIEEGDPYTVAKQQPQQSAPPGTAANTTPVQPPSQLQVETKQHVPAGSPQPGSYLGLDMILQTDRGSTGTVASDDTVFDEHHPKTEAVAERSIEERKKQAKQKRKAGRTDSTKPLMRDSVSSETWPDSPVGEFPDAATTNRRWSSKSPLPPIDDTVSTCTAIRERPRPGSANTSVLSTTSATAEQFGLPGATGQIPSHEGGASATVGRFRLPGAMGQTPPHEGGAVDSQRRLRKPSITLL